MFACLETPIKKYLDLRYGAPTEPSRQYQFYRCEVCRGIVTWKQIASGGCRCGVGSRIRAAHLTLGEKFSLIFSPWRS